MATLTELKQQLTDEETNLVEIKERLTTLKAEITENRTNYMTDSADKLVKIEAALPYQREIDRVSNRLWEIEQAVSQKLSEELDKAEQKKISEARIVDLKADIVAAGG